MKNLFTTVLIFICLFAKSQGYVHVDTFKNVWTSTVRIDGNNNKWLLNNLCQLYKITDDTVIYYDFLSGNYQYAGPIIDKDNNIWFARLFSNIIIKFDGSAIKIDTLNIRSIRSFAYNNNKFYAIGDYMAIIDDSIKYVSLPKTKSLISFSGPIFDKDNNLYLMFNSFDTSKLYKFDGLWKVVYKDKIILRGAELLRTNDGIRFDIFRDNWIGRIKPNFYIDNIKNISYTYDGMLIDNHINDYRISPDSTEWFCTETGIYTRKKNDSYINLFDHIMWAKLPNKYVFSVDFDKNNNPWIVSKNGITYYDENLQTGAKEAKTNFKFYPNPANYNVFCPGNFEIYNINGILLKNGFNNISITDLNNGAYFIRSKNKIQKLIVKH